MGFWNRCFCCSERLVWYIKRRNSFFRNLFSRSMTWQYRGLQGVTWGYNGLQGLTGGYKGLRGVTGGFKWWQGVTSADKGWQGVARRYRRLQRIIQTFFYPERSRILFLGLFCIKIKVEQISNFWPKRWTNPFRKILILRFSYTVVLDRKSVV